MNWHATVAREDLWEGEVVSVPVGVKNVVIVNVAGEVRAFEDRCPHLGGRLSEGILDGRSLTCPNHLWEFDVLTGDGINPNNCRLTVYTTRISQGRIEILLPVGGSST